MGFNARASKRIVLRRRSPVRLVRSARLERLAQLRSKENCSIKKFLRSTPKQDGKTSGQIIQESTILDQLDTDNLPHCQSEKQKEKIGTDTQGEVERVVGVFNERDTKENKPNGITCFKRNNLPYVLIPRLSDTIRSSYQSETDNGSETSTAKFEIPQLKSDPMKDCDPKMPVINAESSVARNNPNENPMVEYFRKPLSLTGRQANESESKEEPSSSDTLLHSKENDKMLGIKQNGAVSFGQQKGHKYLNKLSKKNRLNMYKLNLERRLTRSVGVDVKVNYKSSLPDAKFRRRNKKLQQQPLQKVPSPDISAKNYADNINYVSRPGTSSGYNQSCSSSDVSTLPTILRNSEMTKNSDSEIDEEEDLTESNKARGKNCPKEVVDVIDGIAFVTFESEHDMVRFTRSTTEESPTKADGDLSVQLESHGAITPRKTKDIRKIKGWQRKKFSITLNPMNELNSQDIESSEMNDSSAENIVFEHNYIRRRSNSYEGCAAVDDVLHDFKDASTTAAQHIFSSSVEEEKLAEIPSNASEKDKILEWKPSAKSAFVSFSSSPSDAETKKVDPPNIQFNPCQINVQESSEQPIAEKLSRENSENASDSHNIKMKAIIQQKRAGKRPSPLKVTKAIQVDLHSRQKIAIEEGENVKYPSYNWLPSFQNSWIIDYERAVFAVNALVNKLPRKIPIKAMVPSARKCGRPRARLRNRLNIIGRRRSLRYSVQNPVPVRRTRASCSLFQISEPTAVPLVRIPFVSRKPPLPPPTKSPSVDFSKPSSPVECYSPYAYLLPSSPSSIVETPPSSETNPCPLPVVKTPPSAITNPSPPLVVKTRVPGRITPSSSGEPLASTSNNPENSKIETPISSSLLSSVENSPQISHLQSSEESPDSAKSPPCPLASKLSVHSVSSSLDGKLEETGSNAIAEMDQALRKSEEKKDSTDSSFSGDYNKPSKEICHNNGSKTNLSDIESSEEPVIWEICQKKKFPRKEMSPDQEFEDLRVFLRPKPRFREMLPAQEDGTKDPSFHGVCVRADTSYAAVNNSSPPKNGEVEVFKSSSPKSPALARKKLIRELSKLSANFVSVDNCNSKINEECTKEFCRLGCVCDSIGTDKRQIEHCGRVECMFSCECPPKGHVSRPMQVIGSDTVSRLQEESSRHMAKVEKAFHNTVVEAAGELVLPGRRQRERRLPKRFLDEDIIPEPLFIAKKPKVICSQSGHYSLTNKKNEAKTCHQVQTKPSKIVLHKLPLSGSNIRCMNHFMENCPCLYKSPRNIAVKSTTPRNMAYFSKRQNRIPGFNLLTFTDKLVEKQSHANIGNNSCQDSQSEFSSLEIVVDSDHNLNPDVETLGNEYHGAKAEKESLGTKTVTSKAKEEKKPVEAGNVSCAANTKKGLVKTNSKGNLICREVTSSAKRIVIDKADFTICPDPEYPLTMHCARTAGIDLWISQHFSEASTTGGQSNDKNNTPKKNGSLERNSSNLILQEEATPLFKIVEVKSLPPSSFDAAANTFEENSLNQVDTPTMQHFPNYEYFYSWLNSSQTRCKDLQQICSISLAPLPVNAVKIMKWKDLDKLLKSHSAHMWIRQRLGSSARIYVTQKDVQPDAACVNFLDLEREEELTAKVAHIIKSAQNELSSVHGCCILICKGVYWEIAGNINLNGESQSDIQALETNNFCRMSKPKIVSFKNSKTSVPRSGALKNHVIHRKIPVSKRVFLTPEKPPVGDCNLNNINSKLSSPEMNMIPSNAPKVMGSLNQADILDPDQILLDIETSLPDILDVLPTPKDAEKMAATSRFSPKVVSATSIRDKFMKNSNPNKLSVRKNELAASSKKKVFRSVKNSFGVCKVENCTFTCSSSISVETAPSHDDGNVLEKDKQNCISTNTSSKIEMSSNQKETLSVKYVELETLTPSPYSLNHAEKVIQSAITPTNTNNAVVFPILINEKKRGHRSHAFLNLTDVAQRKNDVENISVISCADASNVKIIPEKENALSEVPSTSCPATNPIRKTASDRIIEKMTSIVESPGHPSSNSSNNSKSGAEAPSVLIIDLKKLGPSSLTKKTNVPVKTPLRVTDLKTSTHGLGETRGKVEVVSDSKTYSAKYLGNDDFSVKEIIPSKDSDTVDVQEVQEKVIQQKGANSIESQETITLTYIKENNTMLTNNNHDVEKPFMHVIQPLGKEKSYVHVIKPMDKLSSTVNADKLPETKKTNPISKIPQTQEKDSAEDLTNVDDVLETSEVPVSSAEPVSIKQPEMSTNTKLMNGPSPTPNRAHILQNSSNIVKADMEHSLEVTSSTSPVPLQNEMGEVIKTKQKSEDSDAISSLSKNDDVNTSQKIIQRIPRAVEKSVSTPSRVEDASCRSTPLPVEMAVTPTSSSDDVVTPSSDVVVTPSSDAVVTPSSSDAVVTPSSSDAVVTPSSSDAVVTPSSSDAVVTPSSSDAVVAPSSSDAVIMPSSSYAVVTPSSSNAVVMPSSSNVVVTPSSSNAVIMPSSIVSDVISLKETKENASEDDVIWYHLHLNHKFDRLTIEGSTFSTSEKRLISAVMIARSSNRTVRLTFDKSASSKECQEFKKGIYAVPTTEGMYVKIGPYRRNEVTGVVTLKKEGQAYKPTPNLLRLEDSYSSSSDVTLNFSNENPACERNSNSSNPCPEESKLNQVDQEKDQSESNAGGDEQNTVEPKLGSDEKITKSAEVQVIVDSNKKVHDSFSVVEDKNSHENASIEKESENCKESVSAEGKIAENHSSEVENDESVAIHKETTKYNSRNVIIKSSNSGKRGKLSKKKKASKVLEQNQEPLRTEGSNATCSLSTNSNNGIQNVKRNSTSGNVLSNPCIAEETEVMLDGSVANNPLVDSHGGEVGEKTDKVVAPTLSLTMDLQDPNQFDVLLEEDENDCLFIHESDSQYDDTGRVSEEEMDVKFNVSKQIDAEGKNKNVNSPCQVVDESTGNEDSGDFAIKIHHVQGNWSGFTDLPNCNSFESHGNLFQHDSSELMTEVDKSLQNCIRHVSRSSKFTKKNKKTGSFETEKSSLLPLEVMERLRKKKLIGPFKTKPGPIKKGRKGLRVSLPVERKHLNESGGGEKKKVLKTLLPKQGLSKTQKDGNMGSNSETLLVSLPDEDENQYDDGGDNKKVHKVLKTGFSEPAFSKITKDENIGSTPGKALSGYLFPDIPNLAPIHVTRGGGSLPSEVSMITLEDPAKPGVNIQLANVECVNAYIMYVLQERIKFYPEATSVNWTFVKADQWTSTSGLLRIKDLTKEMFITPKGVFKYADFTNMEDLKCIGLDRQEKFRFFEMKRRKEIDQAKLELGLLLVSHSKLNEMSLEKILKLASAEIRGLKSQQIELSQKFVIDSRKKLQLEQKFNALLKAQSCMSSECIPAVDESSAIDFPDRVLVNKSSRGTKVKTRGGRSYRGSRKRVANGVTDSSNVGTTASSANVSKGKQPSVRGRHRRGNALTRKNVVNKPSEDISQVPLALSDTEIMPAAMSSIIVAPVQIQDKNITQKCKLAKKSISISPDSVRKLILTTTEPNSTDKNVPEATEGNSSSAIDCINSCETYTPEQFEQPDATQVTTNENKSINALLWKESFRKVKINLAKSTALSLTSHGKILESRKHHLKRKITSLKQKTLPPSGSSSKSLSFWNGEKPPSPKASVS